MSILIKGMKMPTACRHGECNFACSAAYQTGLICIVRKQYVVPGDVPGDCPCSLVPPHGRLIDADALEVQNGWLRDSKYFAQESSHTHITFVYSNDIIDAPTVIPADKDGET